MGLASAIFLPPPSAGTKMMSRHSLAAGARAGLAKAFSAPVAGAVFVLDELVRRSDTRITITTLCASGSAIAVTRLLLDNQPDFQLEPLPYPGFVTVPVFLVLGALTGLMGGPRHPRLNSSG